MPRHLAACVFLASVFAFPLIGSGQRERAVFGRVVRTMTGNMVQLPHTVTDASGNPWAIYQGGWIQMQGNQQVYSQGAMLQINGNQPSVRSNQAKLDDKTGEIIFENLNSAGFMVTRRVLIDREGSYVRYVDIIKNPQGQDVNLNVQIVSNFNFGADQGQSINDPRRKDNVIGWTASNNNGRSVLEMLAGKGSKLTPTFNFQQGNSMVQGQLQVSIPAGKEAAIMHIHTTVGTPDQAVQFIANFKESKVIATLPPELRKILVNFVGGQGFVGERELLRGDLFDVVEIRGGDQMRGTIKEPDFKLATFYGNVTLPASRVIGLINVGDFRPRQLLVTTNGEIFGGKLDKETIGLELTSGQTTQIPLSQIARIGYRKRSDEPEEWTFDKPFVSLRSGDRVAIEMPTSAIDVVTRYGPLKLDPKTLSSIAFQNEEHGVHDIYLTDGSKFAGLVSAPEFEMKLSAAASTQPAEAQPAQVVRFPTSAVSKIQFAAVTEADDDQSATLKMSNDDLLVGSLAGDLKLDTAFDTLTLHAGEIKKLTRSKEGATDVQVQLWDASTVSGQLQDPSIKCQLGSGVTISVPVALLDEYNQPQPKPAASMVEKIKAAVANLNADDFKARDRAESELTSMGAVVVATLKELRGSQPPEAQQRIDQILVNVAKKK